MNPKIEIKVVKRYEVKCESCGQIGMYYAQEHAETARRIHIGTHAYKYMKVININDNKA